MFLKKLIIYTFDGNSNVDQLNQDIIKNIQFTPCSPLDSSKTGFISPLDNENRRSLFIESENRKQNNPQCSC